MAVVTSALAMSTSVGGLIARPSSNRYTTDTLVRGSPPLWMYDQVTVMVPSADLTLVHVGAGAVQKWRPVKLSKVKVGAWY